MNNKETAKKIAELAFLCVMCRSKGKHYCFDWQAQDQLFRVYLYTPEEIKGYRNILYAHASWVDFNEQIDKTIDFLRKEYKS